MYDTLRELHRKFWKELPKPKLERQYDEAFRELMRRLENQNASWCCGCWTQGACWRRMLRSTALPAAFGWRLA